MISIYLDNYYTLGNEVIIDSISNVDSFDITSVSQHYDKNSDNVLIFVEGNESDQLSAFRFPRLDVNTRISDIPTEEDIRVRNELTSRGIIVSDDCVNCVDFLHGILKVFDNSSLGLGSFIDKDFS